MPASILHALWYEPVRHDEYFGTVVNAWIARGGHAAGVKAGQAYVDVGTLQGYREAIRLLAGDNIEAAHRMAEPERQQMDRPRHASADEAETLDNHATATEADAESSERSAFFASRIEQLGPWFHNMRLHGIQTAPNHFLGDYPAVKFERFRTALPLDMTGLTVLDIGCNAGFYSIEMKRRGAARVLGIDTDDRYLRQARPAAEINELDVCFERMAVWDVGALQERFDLVIFMGVLYHLRHPLLALDLIHEHVAKDMFLFQSMQRGSREIVSVEEDYDFTAPAPFDEPGYPKLHFIEHRYSHDQTNWWVPNRACSEAMLRSAGFSIELQPEEEVYLCRWKPIALPADGPHGVYPKSGAA
jgi:tRNA (mo5U34)-methyltransferase